MRIVAVLLLLVCPGAHAAVHSSGAPSTTNNNDTCDIALLPAATLLLPYFEVDLRVASGAGESALFTVTNVSPVEHIAHVTLWTDYAFPVLDFNVALTGYDMQSINLHDVLNGLVPVCDGPPVQMAPELVERVRSAFTRGTIPGCTRVGEVHPLARGYVTVDVVKSCSTLLPAQAAYWESVIAYDNVLAGDYVQLSGGGGGFAQGGPLVHIRAVREGAGGVNLPRTFYGRYQSAASPKRDRRQPLPSIFAARWTDGRGINTSMKIWREGRTGADAPCARYDDNGLIAMTELVTFDEEENAIGAVLEECPCLPIVSEFKTRAAFREDVDSGFFPELDWEPDSGWIYLNLNADEDAEFASQAWVIASLRAEGRYSTDFDAMSLGNGCSAATQISEVGRDGISVIGPAPNTNP